MRKRFLPQWSLLFSAMLMGNCGSPEVVNVRSNSDANQSAEFELQATDPLLTQTTLTPPTTMAVTAVDIPTTTMPSSTVNDTASVIADTVGPVPAVGTGAQTVEVLENEFIKELGELSSSNSHTDASGYLLDSSVGGIHASAAPEEGASSVVEGAMSIVVEPIPALP